MTNTNQIKTHDNIELSFTSFDSDQEANHVALIVPAIGVKQQYYKYFALFLAENGITTYTFDYRGIGKSKPERIKGFQATVSDWGEKDVETMLLHIRKQHPNKTLNIITHSGGGMLLGLAPSASKATKILTVASPRGTVHDWKGTSFLKMSIMVYILLPILPKLFGYFPGKRLKVCENLPKGVSKEWGNWGQNRKSVLGCRPDKKEQYSRINAELLALSFEYDFYAVKESVDLLLKLYPNTSMTRKHFSSEEIPKNALGHFAFFKAANQKYYWDMAKDFLLK